MTDTNIDAGRGDAIWQQAMGWIMREHEESLSDAARNDLRDWLAEAPAHRQAYEQASTLWLVAGLVPTAEEQNNSSSGDD